MRQYILLAITLLLSQTLFSQTIWYADIDEVRESGYYNIEISQQQIGESKRSNLEDMLILNADSTEVPYFLRSASPIQEVKSFENYILKENSTRDSLNIIIVDNQKKEDIKRFYLTIANADVNINVSIRGSENLKQWYTVKRLSAVSNYGNARDHDAMLIIDFPQGNYRYYEIALSNDQKSPLQVKQVSKTESSNIYGQLAEISLSKKIKVENKDKQTIISFPSIRSPYYIHKAEFFISSKTDYLRDAQFMDTLTFNNRYFALSSKSDNAVYINHFLLNKNGVISIDNKNNPPITVDSVKLYGLKRYACAYLEAGKKYFIQIDNERKSYPDYDIEHFKNDIPNSISTIKTVNISSVTKPVYQREQLFIEKPIVLWSIIIGIGLILTILCVKMLKSLKKREEM